MEVRETGSEKAGPADGNTAPRREGQTAGATDAENTAEANTTMSGQNLARPAGRRAGLAFLLIFALLAGSSVIAGYLCYRNYERQYRALAARQLAAIAELKTSDLAQWRKERLGDATLFYQNTAFSALVRRCMEKLGDAGAREQIQTWIRKRHADYPYDQIRLLDTQGGTRLAFPANQPPVAAAVLQRISEVLQSGQIAFHDFYRNEHNQKVYLAVLVPIFDEADGRRPLGVLLLGIDPATYLYPHLQSWPTPSRTAETLLVRREGFEAVFLNELKFQTNTALTLRRSLKNTTLPSVKAALGQQGLGEGLDYRGTSVIADARAVPDSPWFLVTRMDTAEAYAPLRARRWQMILLVGSLICTAGAGAGLGWRRQAARKRAEQEHEHMLLRQESISALQQALLAPAPLAEKLQGITDRMVRLFGADSCRIWVIRPGDLCERGCPHAEIREGSQACHYRDRCLHLLASSGRDPRLHHNGHHRVPLGRGQIGLVAAGKDRQFSASGAENDPGVHSREGAREPELASCAGYQLRVPGGETLGVLALCARRALAPAENALLDGFSRTVASVVQQAQGEEALSQSEQKYRLLADHMPNVIWQMGPDLRITYVNAAVQAVLGYTAAEFSAGALADFCPPECLRQIKEIIAWKMQNIQEHPHVAFETEIRHKSGRRIPVEIHGTIRMDERGKPTGFQGVAHDITARKRADENLIKSTRDLQAALLKVRNTQAQMARKDRLAALGQMASGIAHDFNNVLLPIVGLSEMLLSQPETLNNRAEALSMLKEINAAAQDAKQIVKQLRLIQGSRDEGAYAPVDLNEIARNAVELTRLQWDKAPAAQGARIAIATPLQADRRVLGDAAQLREALTNLILNAVDAMPQGGALNLSSTVENEAVVVAVSDTGTGMTDEAKERCLEPFFTTKGAKGTGLGLSMVHGIVTRHNGTLEIDSRFGKGTTIRIRLPCAPAGTLAAEARPDEAEKDFTITPLRILVADDDASSQNFIERALTHDGHTVVKAQTGREAIEQARAATIDLVITDLAMPEGNGDAVARAVKARRPKLPVILLTGFGELVQDEAERLESVDRILCKPLTRDDLRRAIKETMAGKRRTPHSSTSRSTPDPIPDSGRTGSPTTA